MKSSKKVKIARKLHKKRKGCFVCEVVPRYGARLTSADTWVRIPPPFIALPFWGNYYLGICVLLLLFFSFWLQQLYGFEHYVLRFSAVLGQSVEGGWACWWNCRWFVCGCVDGWVGWSVRTWVNAFFVHVGIGPVIFMVLIVFCSLLYRPGPSVLWRTSVHSKIYVNRIFTRTKYKYIW